MLSYGDAVKLGPGHFYGLFQRDFKLLPLNEQKYCCSLVRDAIEPLVGDMLVVLASESYDDASMTEHLIKSAVTTPLATSRKLIAYAASDECRDTDGRKCASNLLVGYFLSFKSARSAAKTKDEKKVEQLASNTVFGAKQIALLFFSGTEKLNKYAH